MTASLQAGFIVNFDVDEDGNAMVAGTYDIATDKPYENLFGPGSGLVLSTNNPGTLPLNLYDSEGSGGEDPDLERNDAGNGQWDGGTEVSTVLSNLLIVNETTNLSIPDDNGGGGEVTLTFGLALTSFGFHYADLDFATRAVLILTDSSTSTSVTIPFTAFEDGSGSVYEISGALFGDRHANHITGITAAKAGLTRFDEVLFRSTSSGGIGSLEFSTVPEPGCGLVMLLFGALTVFHRRRRAAAA